MMREWLESQVGELYPESLVFANVTEKTAAVAALTKWTASECELTVAAIKPGWASRQFFRYIADLAFLANDCKRVTANISANNRKSWRAVERAGFTLEGVKRQAAEDGSDVRVYGMLKEECKWLHQPDHKEWHKECRDSLGVV